MIHTDHYGAEISTDGGDAIAFPMFVDGALTLGYLLVRQTSETELIGVDLRGEPLTIRADQVYAVVRGLDEKRPRKPRIHYR